MTTLGIVPAPLECTPTGGHLPITSELGAEGELAWLLIDEIAAITGIRLAEGPQIQLRLIPGIAAEGYQLETTEDAVTVLASDQAGLRLGIWTLVQTLTRTEESWALPCVRIVDKPRFAYRGFMLDVARRFFDVDAVKAVIDRIARLKFNVLHLHLSDDQAWRLELASHPRLTANSETAAALGGAGGSYTASDYQEILDHAAGYDITVVPEIDLPGHTHCVSVAYPDLVEDPVITTAVTEVLDKFGGSLPTKGKPFDGIAVGFSSLKIRHEPTYTFLHEVLSEVAAKTPGPWLHVGGDECLGTAEDDFAYFMSRITEMVTTLGKTPIVWHEAGAAQGIAPQTIGQYWGLRNPDEATATKARAFQGGLILSPGDAAYLDMKYDESEPLGLTWAGMTSLQRAYEWEPSHLIPGITEDQILGVEAALWTETIATLADLDHMVFPRIAATAEAAWSTPENKSFASFAQRVAALSKQWDAYAISYHRAPGIDWDV